MPPLFAALLVGAGAYAGVKVVKRILANWPEMTGAVAAPAASSTVPEKDLGRLVLDPATGIYRPATPLR
ncbi:MAG: hypothetical protein AB7L90_17695 [Hyphomicrobiaceae bacterium]